MGKITEKAIRIDEGDFDIFLNEHPEIKFSTLGNKPILRLGNGVELSLLITNANEVIVLEYIYNGKLYSYHKK